MTSPNPAPDFPTHYDPATSDPEIYRQWQDAGVYVGQADRSARVGGERAPFTIVIPPPNVTAVLHMGHGLNNTVQDVLVRWRRMAGDEALWVPGTDHAGIATQNVVEKLVAKEGKTRFDLGREAFVARTAQFVEETGGVILDQLKAIGASADWSRTAYTLTPELSRAVREAFVRLYEKGLIYRGHRVIHWCPRCETSLSDEEAEFHDSQGKLYHVSYPLVDDPAQSITIATTRPETIFADVAIAVHPDDERYAALVGKQVRIPVTGIAIPVIADAYVEREFGTGALKITPAHDANDFEVGKRHGLAMPVVIDATGHMAEEKDADGRLPEAFKRLDRFEARKRMAAELEAAGRLLKVETHANAVRRCYRCDTVVEPRLSDQWFVKMAPLAAPALEAVRTGKVRILPERWEAVYVNWLEGIRDWNISRQLWWGHRVPVFYCANGHVTASRDDLAACPECQVSTWQDEDVLDTWFSSWLWPISTLGWPDADARDLKAFYPTDVLVTAPEILFFWVARMIMSGYEFMGEAPFHTVYLHGTVRDTQHRKMSKSLGNGIDPMDVVRLYGADALRWTSIAGMGLGADVILDHKDLEKSFAPGRNFVTKLWNIARFLLTNTGSAPVQPLAAIDASRLGRADRWILDRLDQAIADCDDALGPTRPTTPDHSWTPDERYAGLRLNEYAEAARRFVWNELADWYLESVKGRLTTGDADAEVARAVLVHCFDQALRLLHPVIPFITEALYQRLPTWREGTFITTAAWPTRRAERLAGGDEFELPRAAIGALRELRAQYNVAPGKQLEATIVADGQRAVFEQEAAMIGRITRVTVTVAPTAPNGNAAHALLPGGAEVILPLEGVVDLAKERQKAEAEHANLDKQLAGLRGRLANEGFTSRAKPEIVEAERQKEREWTARLEQLAAKVRQLGGQA